jgi:exopolysaccharide production protein ExoZ
MAQLAWSPDHSGTPRKQLLSIQYLRGLAAMSVLVTHALQWPLAEMNMVLLKTGRLGVDVFFVISGFIITTIGGDGQFNPRDFLVRRAGRIVPAYWAATLLIAVLALTLPSLFRTTIPTPEGLLKSLLFIPSLNPKAPLLLLGWSLNFEAFFYVLFASLFFLSSEARTLVLLGLLAVLIGIGQFATSLDYVTTIYTSPSLLGFAFGTILAQAHRHGLLARFKPSLGSTIAVLGILLASFYMDDWGVGEQEIALWKHLLMSATALSIVLFALSHETAGKIGNIPLLKYLGDTSYSIYLFHLFAVGAVWAISKRFFDVHQMLPYLSCATLAILVGLAAGVTCYYLVEKRSQAIALKSLSPLRARAAQSST